MASCSKVTVPLLDGHQVERGELVVYTLPNRSQNSTHHLLLDERGNPERDLTLEPVQLLEGMEYRFTIEAEGELDLLSTDRPDIFQPDDEWGRSGRVRPGMRVGALPVKVYKGGSVLGEAALEVRSRRLNYLGQYRWMLRDIAEQFAEALMERFAGTEQRFSVDESASAQTLYQRFAFIKSLLEDERFVSAMQLVLSRPYAAWYMTTERRHSGWGVKGSSAIVRQLNRPGPRVRVQPDGDQPGVLLPRELDVQHSAETVDNGPNRFVKFTLEKWRIEVLQIRRVLASEPQTVPAQRGLRELAMVLAQLETYLSAPLFRDVSPLRQIPSSNPVMARKEGYRDIYGAHIQSEMAAQLAWSGGEDVYGAGQRNVAALYEYWVFLQLAHIVSDLCDQPFDLGQLLEVQENGLNLVLARTVERALVGQVTGYGRALKIQLWFNRTFSAHEPSSGSWTRAMRPDCSLLLQPAHALSADYRSIWVHFDAKYRAEELVDVLGTQEDVVEATADSDMPRKSEARHSDLLKMHAYRDAIRRSAGAYVIYPGTDEEECREYHELLPGLGAFGLSPSSAGAPVGETGLKRFLVDVFAHAASQVSQHERERFWISQAYGHRPSSQPQSGTAPFLVRPPADSLVLLGYVKSPAHLAWIQNSRLYNLRADGRKGGVGLDGKELAAEFAILYGTDVRPQIWNIVGEPRVLSELRMRELEYPKPGGTLYFCLPIEPLEVAWDASAAIEQIERVRSQLAPQATRGAPVVASWLEVLTT